MFQHFRCDRPADAYRQLHDITTDFYRSVKEQQALMESSAISQLLLLVDPAFNANISTDSSSFICIRRCDTCIYSQSLDVLKGNVHVPLSTQTFASLRRVANSLEDYIVQATLHFTQGFRNPKVELIARFGHLVVRVLGVNQR